MTARTRLTYLACAVAVTVGASSARAQSPAQQAESLNEAGKRLFAEKRYEEAYAQFQQAATLSPEGRFFFNMCYALNFLNRYEQAIEACEQVEPAGADAELVEKTERALASLREKLAAQQAANPPDPGQPTDPTDPTTPGPGQTPPPGPVQGQPVAQPTGPDPFLEGQSQGVEDSYAWSVGGELTLLGNLGIGRVDLPGGGSEDLYAGGGAGVRLFADFIVHEPSRFGLQGYLGIGNLPPSDANTFDEPVTMADIGGAVFTHRPLGNKMYWTPLAGLHFAVQQPQELSTGFIGLGGRAEVAFSYLVGPNSEHELSIAPGIQLYFPMSGTVDGIPAEAYGFDKARGAFTVGLGYSYRFSTPFGSTPLITLE